MADFLRWLRGRLGQGLVPLVYATAIIEDEAGQLLCQRRADFGDAWWGLPGGLFEPGETPEGCLVREVREETGLEVVPARLTGVYSSPRYQVTYPNGDQVQQVTLCYACRVVGGALRPDLAEITDLRYWPAAALPPLPAWYADMLAHRHRPEPYFDPPERAVVTTEVGSLAAVRQRVGRAAVLWPGAVAIVSDTAGRVLLQRRNDTGLWAPPAGGLEAGESLVQAVVREARKEAGVTLDPERLLSVHAGHQHTDPNGDRLYPLDVVFACRLAEGAPRAADPEAAATGWFGLHALPPLQPGVAMWLGV